MTTATTPARMRQWLPIFLLLGAIWGSSFLFIKVAVGELHPLYVTLGRVSVGAVTLLGLLALTGVRLPRDPRLWAHLSVVAVLLNAVPFTLFGYGEQRVSSIFAGIWNATTPLTTLLVAMVVLPTERPTRTRIAGLVVGFAGVMVVLGVWQGVGGGVLAGHLMCFGAACSYGFGIPYTRRFLATRPDAGAALPAGQLIIATALLAVVAPLVAGPPPAPTTLSANVIGSVLALGALGTGVAFALGYRVIRLAGATTASSVTYQIPVFATVAGVAVLGEEITWHLPVGGLIVLAGVAISQGVLGRLRALRRVSGTTTQRVPPPEREKVPLPEPEG